MRFLLSIFILFSPGVFAANYYVWHTTGSNVSQEEMDNLTEILRASISQQRRHRVVDEFKWAQLQLKPRLMKLDRTYLLTLELNRKWGRPQIMTLTARRFEDLLPGIQRLVKDFTARS